MIDAYGLDAAGSRWRQAAATLAAEVLAAHAVEVDTQARFPHEGMAALAQKGFYGLCLYTQYGGQGQGPATFSAVVEELAGQCASTAMVYVMHVTAAKVIESPTTVGAKAEVLRSIAAGEHLTTLAFSEQAPARNSGPPSPSWKRMGKAVALMPRSPGSRQPIMQTPLSPAPSPLRPNLHSNRRSIGYPGHAPACSPWVRSTAWGGGETTRPRSCWRAWP